jgi:hypothetical protein
MSMLQSGDSEVFDEKLGRLAHIQLRLLQTKGPATLQALATQAIELVDDGTSSLTLKEASKMANAALRALDSKRFVLFNLKHYQVTERGLQALERYPDSFSSMFVQRELLAASNNDQIPIQSGWGSLMNKKSRRRS